MNDESGRQEQHSNRKADLGRILEDSLNEIYIFDTETLKFIFVNKGARRNLGYTMAELSVLTPIDIKPQYTSESFVEVIRPLNVGEQDKLVFETVHRRKDGSTYPVEVHLQRSTFEGAPVFVAIILDITKQKQREQIMWARLRLSEYGMAHSIDHLMQKTIDEAEQLTDSQIGFLHFVHEDQNTLTLQTWSTNTVDTMCNMDAQGQHYPIEEAGVWVACIHERKPIIHNDYINHPYRKGLPDGHAPVTRELVVPIMHNDLIVAILGVGNKPYDYTETDIEAVFQIANMGWDIIARKRAETELQRIEQVIALKDRFISIVSHEFRTPLSIIQTTSDVLIRHSDKLPPERLQQSFDQIRQQVKDLANLIDKVLSLNQAQVDKTEFTPALINLEPFCLSIFEQMQFTDTAQHTFVFSSDIPPDPIMIDGYLIRHILTNLLTNAIKYSPNGSQISLKLNHNNDGVSINVSDNGIGIPPEDLEHLFEPFHRANNVGNTSGTGLGLSIVKQYAELHGGTIEVESTLGKGTTFKVYLPHTPDEIHAQ